MGGELQDVLDVVVTEAKRRGVHHDVLYIIPTGHDQDPIGLARCMRSRRFG